METKKLIRIFYFEDDPEMIDLVNLILGRLGYEVKGTASGAAGIETVKEEAPDLILLDLMMPGMDGWDVYHQLKAIDNTKDIPVIVVTARAQPIDRVLGLHIAKVDGYLCKPFHPKELQEAVEWPLKYPESFEKFGVRPPRGVLIYGPPGTGKTSLGKSIAEVLGRKYVRISLGGVKDEAEIRGHRRTYLGALPGRIIQGMKRAGEKNPVFILDEVDKLMAAYNGDPASALLEVLDPEQNDSFSDHYLDVPYDLSDVFFIATANSLRGIPEPLRDRMEIIEIGSYTSHEKFNIAKNHLISIVLEEHGLDETQLQIDDEALKTIIEKYTREAGVRGIKRQLSAVARVVSEKIVVGKVDIPYVVKDDMLYDILGHELTQYDLASKNNPPGVVTGLAWTPVGGEILFIEGAFMPGNGKLTLTGQLGDVMKESAKISQSLIRSRLAFNLKSVEFDKKDLHIHVPSGSIPKDGPSAGVVLLTTIASLVTGHEVDPKLAMTGEISLRGAVLPVGGIKEKVIAAHRAGIERIILPKENLKDLDDVPKDVRDEIKFIPVDTVEDVIKETIGIELPKPMMLEMTTDHVPGGAGL